ncbi:helix-turn-helix transcriptional regulator [Dermabacter hominis]|uniref:helix-turn-helix domain-containing protein n=1 Tax=Dermabacter hominis TaxID=36740 RepID=UPI0021A75B06|nr:helix-turn-helix transcriptional regulator [Dermabacter hominis]MCT2056910.1 helix-turn-helix transcriptional regulator [Dermabacter hominis]MCT2084385.1 helix-turn-helix transcriptional regulator [Dermabacter hominis]MCT2091785.1 helix-turn-helix transcriptional regulator [Dermabacter hominis]MCT2190827.1 helix-turn-helix transcriptional regulator [Dermabacter hominis]MCT2227980.1 helix-turn-helix transcriptional regulator [Dermabacter hominis]
METEAFVKALGAEVRTAATVAQVKIGDLAEAVGVSRMSLTRYLNGEREMTVPTLCRIADVLGVSAATLIERATRRAEEDARITKADFALAAYEEPNQGAVMRDALDTRQESPEPFYDGDEPA